MHAEGFAAGELKHGPIALIEEGLPVVVIVPPRGRGVLHDKVVSNIQEIRARGARTIVIAEEGDEAVVPYATNLIRIPTVADAAAAAAVDRAAAGVRLRAGHRQGPRRRPAAQPREVGHGRVGGVVTVVGIGVDAVLVERFAASLARTPGLAERLFTDAERGAPRREPGRAVCRERGRGQGDRRAQGAAAGTTSRCRQRRAAGRVLAVAASVAAVADVAGCPALAPVAEPRRRHRGGHGGGRVMRRLYSRRAEVRAAEQQLMARLPEGALMAPGRCRAGATLRRAAGPGVRGPSGAARRVGQQRRRCVVRGRAAGPAGCCRHGGDCRFVAARGWTGRAAIRRRPGHRRRRKSPCQQPIWWSTGSSASVARGALREPQAGLARRLRDVPATCGRGRRAERGRRRRPARSRARPYGPT